MCHFICLFQIQRKSLILTDIWSVSCDSASEALANRADTCVSFISMAPGTLQLLVWTYSTMNISLSELHKHKYHGISSHSYFISRNTVGAKALKRQLSEVQIFCDLIHAAVFFHVSRKEQMRELISVRWPAPQQERARAAHREALMTKWKKQAEFCKINYTFCCQIK